MFGVSMAGTVLIVGFSYASPHLLPGYGLDEAIGTTFIIIGYLLVFILVPRFENTLMRHKSFNQKEVSTVLKLVFFQARATPTPTPTLSLTPTPTPTPTPTRTRTPTPTRKPNQGLSLIT